MPELWQNAPLRLTVTHDAERNRSIFDEPLADAIGEDLA